MASLWRRTMVFLGLTDDPDEDEDYDDRPAARERGRAGVQPLAAPEPEAEAGVGAVSMGLRPLAPRDAGARGDEANGTGIAPPTPRPSVVRPLPPAQQSPRVHVVEPSGFRDAQEIGDRMKGGQPVIVTMQAIDAELSRRLIDFCSGATYVLGGSMEKVATRVFLLTPSNVEVSAEEKRRLSERGLYRSAP